MALKRYFILIILIAGIFLFYLNFTSGEQDLKTLEKVYTELDGKDDEVIVKDSFDLDGFSEATWNIWVKQENYMQNAGLIGKYFPRTGKRSYIIRTILQNGMGIILSGDGINTETHSTISDRACGIRNNGSGQCLQLFIMAL